jgi:hypothetical protein
VIEPERVPLERVALERVVLDIPQPLSAATDAANNNQPKRALAIGHTLHH